MEPLCTICNVLMNLGEGVYVIKCGHLFHHHCLVHWTERSATCPHCHTPVTLSDIFRVNPTLSSVPRDESTIMHLQATLHEANKELERLRLLCNSKEEQINILKMSCKTSDDIKKTYQDKLQKFNDKMDQLNIARIENERLKSELQNATKNYNAEKDAAFRRDNAIAESKIRELRGEVDKLKRNIQTLNGNLSSSKESLASRDDAVAALKEQLANAKKLLSQETNGLMDENQTLKRNLTTLNGNLSSVRENLTYEKLTVAALKEQLDNLRKGQEKDALKLKEENEILKRNIETLNRSLYSKNENLASRESAVAALKEQLAIAKSELNQKVHSGFKEENVTLRKNIETLNWNLSTAKENLASQRATVVELKDELSKAQGHDETVKLLKEENETLRKSIQGLSGNLSVVKEQVSNRDSTITLLRSQIKLLEKQNEENEVLKKDLQSFNRHIIKILGSVDKVSMKRKGRYPTAGTSGRRPRRNLGSKAPSRPQKKRDVLDESSSDNSSDCDSDNYLTGRSDGEDKEYESEIELINRYKDDPDRMYQALLNKKTASDIMKRSK